MVDNLGQLAAAYFRPTGRRKRLPTFVGLQRGGRGRGPAAVGRGGQERGEFSGGGGAASAGRPPLGRAPRPGRATGAAFAMGPPAGARGGLRQDAEVYNRART
jgi:hypothetical protein